MPKKVRLGAQVGGCDAEMMGRSGGSGGQDGGDEMRVFRWRVPS